MENSHIYHGNLLLPFEFEIKNALALENLLTMVELNCNMVRDFINGDIKDKTAICWSLYNEGILEICFLETPDMLVQTGWY